MQWQSYDIMEWHTIARWFLDNILNNVGWKIMALIASSLGVYCLKSIADLKGKAIETVTKWDKFVVGGTVFLFVLCALSALSMSFSGAIESIGLQNRPDFKMSIMNPSLADANPRSHTFAVDARIWNAGWPSVVVGWSLKIKGTDKKNFDFPEIVLVGSNAVYVAKNNDGTERVYKPPDSMEEKAGEIPIERGGEKSGFVLFQITDTARDYLLSPDSTYEISCTDIAGKEYSMSFSWPAPSK